MAENLFIRGVQTTIVELADQVQVMRALDPAMAAIVQAHLKEKGIVLELGQKVENFKKRGNTLAVFTRTAPSLGERSIDTWCGFKMQSSEEGVVANMPKSSEVMSSNYLKNSSPAYVKINNNT
ncbi:MAG: NAD-binding protein [Desulfomonilaceae bacterium]